MSAVTVTDSGPSLRDLSDAEFLATYRSDRFTASVLANRMRFIVEHMSAGILTNAFSLILRDWYDFNASIAGPPDQNYPMPAVGNSLASFFGTMSEAVRNAVEEHGPENLEPGDVLIANDPYRCGNHVNDMCFIRPVFVDSALVSFVTIRAHQLDMGGTVPAGFSSTKRNVYDTGLSLGPTLLYRNDDPVRSTFNVILDNVRFGEVILPDIKTVFQSLRLGERLLLESIERYGLDAYLGAIRFAIDSSAESMAAALRAIPDGTYTAEEFVDADGIDDSVEYRVEIVATKVDDRLEIDFSGSSPQARTCINASALDTKAAVVIAMKFLIDPRSRYTSGAFRNIDIVLPPGTLLSATPPDGAVFLYWEATQPVMRGLFRAMAEALGPRAIGGDHGSMGIHNANGVLPDGTPWVAIGQTGAEHGPWGATQHGDADSYQVIYPANSLDPATETIESEVPAVVLRKEYVEDSAGAGENRGGAAVRKDTLYLSDAEHWSSPLATKRPSGIGVNGGGAGAMGGVWLFPPEIADVRGRQDLVPVDDDAYAKSVPVAGVLDPASKRLDPGGDYFYFASTPVWQTDADAVFRYQGNGGGGWGDPLRRDPDRVRIDVRDEYVSIAAAAAVYGVIITGDPVSDPEGVRVDIEATTRERAKMREAQNRVESR
jgi:N-methylhydantoinase B